jgi:ABC-2 type transport system ATP-binding protein
MELQISDCSFGYRPGVRVLDNYSQPFGNGRTVLLGPNGAGKSTLLALLANSLQPDSGRVVLGARWSPQVWRERKEFRKRVAWLPQQVVPFPGLTVREHVAYAGWLKGLSRRDAWERSASALEAVDLESLSGRRAAQLSGGQTRRMGLAGALVHEAQAILLDEPTAGLDPAQRARFRAILDRIGPDRILIVSTHQTEDVHESYDRVVLLVDGTTPFAGSVADFVADRAPEADVRDRVTLAYQHYVSTEV